VSPEFLWIFEFLSHVGVYCCRKEGDHEFMNIVSNEIADEVMNYILPLNFCF